MDRAEQAVLNKKNGMNCAQSVVAAFSDLTDVSEETLLAMTQALGVGIGATMEGTCGAVNGASMMIGLLCKEEGRPACMKKAGTLLKSFQTQNHSVVCKELKGIGTGVVLRECNDCVRDAAKLLEEILEIKE